MSTAAKTATLFLAFNEAGDVTADMDRDTAIDRLNDDHGGEHRRVIEMTITLPELADLRASFSIPAESPEKVDVTTA